MGYYKTCPDCYGMKWAKAWFDKEIPCPTCSVNGVPLGLVPVAEGAIIEINDEGRAAAVERVLPVLYEFAAKVAVNERACATWQQAKALTEEYAAKTFKAAAGEKP